MRQQSKICRLSSFYLMRFIIFALPSQCTDREIVRYEKMSNIARKRRVGLIATYLFPHETPHKTSCDPSVHVMFLFSCVLDSPCRALSPNPTPIGSPLNSRPSTLSFNEKLHWAPNPIKSPNSCTLNPKFLYPKP